MWTDVINTFYCAFDDAEELVVYFVLHKICCHTTLSNLVFFVETFILA